MKIWINGKVIYEFNGVRAFADDQFANKKVNISINEGEKRLLAKTLW